MYRFLLQPRWLALHAATVLIVVGFVVLGWWQLKTFQLVEDRQDRLTEQPVAISDVAAPGERLPDSATGRRVSVSGRYAADQQVLVPNRVLDRVAGSYVVTPLVTADGATVPVLRGWIDRPGDAGEVPAAGPVSVTGILVEPESEEAAAVDPAEIGGGQLAFIAAEPLAAATGIEKRSLYDGFVLLTEQRPAAQPAPDPLPVAAVLPGRGTSPWQNLSYWAQWWIFAAAALVFWGSFIRTAVRDRRRAAASSPVDEGQVATSDTV